ncbi:Cell division inhibitor [gamma proteobacterium IMCC2047]|nr:Cell division inhibitor [gamma proteobacterium IMCC2047]
MRILITGGTGFIGARLCAVLREAGHQLVVYSRQPAGRVKMLCGEGAESLNSLDNLSGEEGIDAVINLAGESIAAKRWTPERKQQLLDSRLNTTQALLDAMAAMPKPPGCLINASAVGFYGDQGDRLVDEDSQLGDLQSSDFGRELCQRWEQTALQAEALGVRVCIVRIGVVVGAGGGFLSKMLPPFKLGLGGQMGSGQQWMSWVHREDLINIIIWLLEHPDCSGPYNATSPGAVRNKAFTKTLADALNRPALLPMPSVVAKAMFGEMSQLLLTGQHVVPKRITDAGFEFKYADLKSALSQVLS